MGVSRVSLFDKFAAESTLGDELEDGAFCMVDNHTIHAISWKNMGWEIEPDPPPGFGGGLRYPDSATIWEVKWNGRDWSATVLATVPNIWKNAGTNNKRMGLNGHYGDGCLACAHITTQYVEGIGEELPGGWGDPGGYSVFVLGLRHFPEPPIDSPPSTIAPYTGVVVVTVGDSNTMVFARLPDDADGNHLRLQGPGAVPGIDGRLGIKVGLNIREHSVPPEGWVFPDDGACPPTGGGYCPAPTLVAGLGGATWESQQTNTCTGWSETGEKEIDDTIYGCTGGGGAVNPSNSKYYYTAVRDNGQYLLMCDGDIEEAGFDGTIYAGKDNVYGIRSSGDVFIIPSGYPLCTVPVTDTFSHALDDKYPIIWTATEGGIVGSDLTGGEGRTISVDWPLDPTTDPPEPYLFRYPNYRHLAMRILAGEIILEVCSGDGKYAQNDFLILKENLPIGWSRYWESGMGSGS